METEGMPGVERRYFEDLEIGQRETVGRYTVKRDEIVAFAAAWDPQPYHVNEDAARDSVFGGLSAAGCHVFSIFMRLTHAISPPLAILAALQIELEYPHAVRPGDTLVLTTACSSKRPSRNHEDRGVARFTNSLANQDGETVLVVNAALLIARRPT